MKNYELINREYNWYKLALTYFEEHPEFSFYTDGVCKALKHCGVDLAEGKYRYNTRNKDLLFTLYSCRTTNGLWWFNDREERIKALKKSIAICIKKRELIWLRMAREVMKGEDCFAEGVCTILYDLGVKFKDFYVKGEYRDNTLLLPTLHSVRTVGIEITETYWFKSDNQRVIGLEKAISILEKEVGVGGILPKQ